MALGTLEHYYELEAWLNEALLQKPLKRKQQRLFLCLLLGLYQIRYLSTPDHAAVSETVKLAKAPWEKKLLNACLRKACATRDHQSTSEEARFNHPQWLIDKIRAAYPEDWQALLAANQRKAPNTFRVMERDAWLAEHPALGAHPHPACETAVVIPDYEDLHAIPGFDSGRCSVQDVASQLVAPLLDLQPQQKVLDACSAPGGKACHILQSEPDLEKLVCIEKSEARIPRLEENLARSGVQAEIICADATTHAFGETFSRILLDAPCSATGIIRRHPDVKLNRNENNIHELNETQLAILEHLWACLEPGGKLLYTTCSILPDENESIISKFLTTHDDALLCDITLPIGKKKTVGHQLLPLASQDQDAAIDWSSDGFYFCLLKKEFSACPTRVKPNKTSTS